MAGEPGSIVRGRNFNRFGNTNLTLFGYLYSGQAAGTACCETPCEQRRSLRKGRKKDTLMRKLGAVCTAKLTAILCMGLALAGCQYLRNALGVTKSPPNEFAVTTQPPLVLPPDLNLRPPQAGAAPRYALPASEQAKRVVFADNAPKREAMADHAYSDGEMFLLVQAIAVNVDPGIRRTILDRKSVV